MSLLLVADIGGSKTNLSFFTQDGVLVRKTRVATPAEKGPHHFINFFVEKIDHLMHSLNMKMDEVAGLGICIAGFYDYEKDIVVHSPNLIGWDGFPLKKELANRLGIKPLIENDANAAAWGEYIYSLYKKPKNMVYVTISTGIGSGIVLNREIYRGERGFAGEIGHLKVQEYGEKCPCGSSGCLERVAAGEAMTRIAKEKLLTTKKDSLLLGKNELNTKTVFQAAKKNDPLAYSIVNKGIYYLSLGLSHYINLFNPGYLILGGGVMKDYNYIYPILRKHLDTMVIKPSLQDVTVQKAGLGSDSGLYGMLALLKEKDSLLPR